LAVLHVPWCVLDDATLDHFVEDGFLELRSAVPASIVDECQHEIADALFAEGVDVDVPTTWKPVVRVDCPRTPAFETAGRQPVLTDAYDALLSAETWWKPRGVGGTIPVRFPSESDPGDAGWHVDGSYEGDGGYWVNVASKARALLCLFLFSDVGPDDAPTELKIGSHLDIPAILEPFGEAGMNSTALSVTLPRRTLERPSAFATGRAGDVFVCHPFLVHRATWPHRGTGARMIAQPGIMHDEPFVFDGVNPSPVENAIRSGLDPSRNRP
jgi:hypothetical protein